MPEDPVTDAEFAKRMARFGVFESRPRLAVAVSGGSDSMALCLLAHAWATARGGSVLALTVDHGLRRESAAEAAQVGAWLAGHGIAQTVLTWTGPKPGSGLQAAARAARYRLLTACCRDEGILHLALAHHREDQAETLLLRLAKGSGVDGLAAMAGLRETGPVRLLRPMLDLPKARLKATCVAAGQAWVDDPSNLAEVFARGRVRAVAASLGREGLTPERLAETARRAGRARAALEGMVAAVAARAVAVYPEGYLRLDAAALSEVSEEIALRLLSRCLGTIGGARHPPRLEAVERLFGALSSGGLEGGRTLGGCRVAPWRGRVLMHREPAAADAIVALEPDAPAVWWDRRFRVRLLRPAGQGGCRVARLGAEGWATLRAQSSQPGSPQPGGPAFPGAAGPALPAVWDAGGLVAVPHFGFLRPDEGRLPVAVIEFTPGEPVAPPAFVPEFAVV